MDGPPSCRGGTHTIWRSAVAALILLVLVTATAFLATTRWQGKGEGALYDGQSAGFRRQRRDTGEVVEISAADVQPTTSASGVKTGKAIHGLLLEKSRDYFPVYREVGGRSIDWNGEQMSTDGAIVQSETDLVDNEEEEDAEDYDESADDYDYMDDKERDPQTSKSGVPTDNLEQLIGGNVSSSSPRGKEFEDYYSDLDDGQKFDEEEYETAFITPGMHYGDNVEIVKQVTAVLFVIHPTLQRLLYHGT